MDSQDSIHAGTASDSYDSRQESNGSHGERSGEVTSGLVPGQTTPKGSDLQSSLRLGLSQALAGKHYRQVFPLYLFSLATNLYMPKASPKVYSLIWSSETELQGPTIKIHYLANKSNQGLPTYPSTDFPCPLKTHF